MKKILFIGGFIVLLFTAHGIAQPIPPNAGEEYVLVNEWGSFGVVEGQFWNPTGIAVDATGNVYVADRDNHRIQKFTADGQFINAWGWYGPLDGQMRFPSAVAVDNSGNVYVTDSENCRVQKFSSDGAFIIKWGRESETANDWPKGGCECSDRIPGSTLLFPQAIYVDVTDSLYVIDNCNIQKFGFTGQFIKDWSHDHDADHFSCVEGGDFTYYPYHLSMAIASDGHVYLIGQDQFFFLIYEYTSDGAFIRKWSSPDESGDQPIGEFTDLSGIAVDSSKNVYAVDRKYEEVKNEEGKSEGAKIRVIKFTQDGQYLTQWDFPRNADLNEAEVINTGIAIDKTGNVYILNGNSVQKFAIGGSTTTSVPGDNTKPQASFTVTPSNGSVETTFSFDASGSTDNESTSSLLAVRWDWEDDGTWDTEYTTTKIATHQYSVAGFYTIRLEVKDPQGLTNTASKKIIVWAKPQLCAASDVMGKNNQKLGTLRKFRDNVLAGSLVGNKIIELYYNNGARIIGILEKMPALKRFTKLALERMIPLIENQ